MTENESSPSVEPNKQLQKNASEMMKQIKPLASVGARAAGLRGAVSGRGSVLSKDSSKQSVLPMKKRAEIVD